MSLTKILIGPNSQGIADVQAGSGSGGTPAAPDTSVQFNDGGVFGGSANFTWDNITNILSILGDISFSDNHGLLDANGNEVLLIDTVTSAVNYLVLGGAATGTNPTLTAAGDNTNVGIDLAIKGTGTVNLAPTIVTANADTFPNAWGNNLKLTASLYPGLWFHGTSDNRGLIYAHDASARIFVMQEVVSGAVASATTLNFNFADKAFYNNLASEWDLGTSAAPWGGLYSDAAVITGPAETFPGGWGNNLKLTASQYPALWFHSSSFDRGVIYAHDSNQRIFFLQEVVSGAVASATTLRWDFANRVFYNFLASEWDLGTSDRPWGGLYTDAAVVTGPATSFPNGWQNNLKLTATTYPALWFHGTNNDRGLVYAYDATTRQFWMDEEVSGVANTNVLIWDFANGVYRPQTGTWSLGNSSKPWANVVAQQYTPVAGTTTLAPIILTSGTNLTTAAAGAFEYDGKCIYATTVASSRQVADTEQFVTVQGSNVALSNSSTSAQNVFASANDVLSLAAATTYQFECELFIATGTTTHTTALGFVASSAFTGINYLAQLWSVTDGTISTTAPSVLRVTVSTATVLNATSGAPFTIIRARGIIRTNAASTVTPQITFDAGPTGTCEVMVNSYFRIWPIGSNTVAAVGNWA